MSDRTRSALRWFDAVSVGSLATSGSFYLAYGLWKPMVWSAIAVGSIRVVQHFAMVVDG